MEVTKERFTECAEPDVQGLDPEHDYHYTGQQFLFPFGTCRLVVRQYDDTPTEASVLCSKPASGGRVEPFRSIPYQDPAFREAIAYLVTVEGISDISLLLPDGYVPVDLTRMV